MAAAVLDDVLPRDISDTVLDYVEDVVFVVHRLSPPDGRLLVRASSWNAEEVRFCNLGEITLPCGPSSSSLAAFEAFRGTCAALARRAGGEGYWISEQCRYGRHSWYVQAIGPTRVMRGDGARFTVECTNCSWSSLWYVVSLHQWCSTCDGLYHHLARLEQGGLLTAFPETRTRGTSSDALL